MTRVFKTFCLREDGQGLAEYALILVLVALSAIAATTALSSSLSSLYSRTSGDMQRTLQRRAVSGGLYGSHPSLHTSRFRRKRAWSFR